jgi:F0F1-type ATP synthase assembly protein I
MTPLKVKSVADAYRLASRVTSLGMGCVTPPLIGYLVDEWQSTKPIGVLIGSLLGFLSLFVQLRQLVRDMAREFPEHKNSR